MCTFLTHSDTCVLQAPAVCVLVPPWVLDKRCCKHWLANWNTFSSCLTPITHHHLLLCCHVLSGMGAPAVTCRCSRVSRGWTRAWTALSTCGVHAVGASWTPSLEHAAPVLLTATACAVIIHGVWTHVECVVGPEWRWTLRGRAAAVLCLHRDCVASPPQRWTPVACAVA
jgi:hypothetical protein